MRCSNPCWRERKELSAAVKRQGINPAARRKQQKSSVCPASHSYSILMSVNGHVVCSLWGNKLNVEAQTNSNLPITSPFIFKWHSSLRATDVINSAVEGTIVGFPVLYVKPLVPFLREAFLWHLWLIFYFKLAANCGWLFFKPHSCGSHQERAQISSIQGAPQWMGCKNVAKDKLTNLFLLLNPTYLWHPADRSNR